MRKEDVCKVLSDNPEHIFKKCDLPSGFFTIDRASGGDLCVSNEVFVINTHRVDSRNCSIAVVRDLTHRWCADFLSHGFGHSEVDGCAVRYYGSDCDEYIYLGSLNELIDFTKEHGSLVLDVAGIFIYDDYLE